MLWEPWSGYSLWSLKHVEFTFDNFRNLQSGSISITSFVLTLELKSSYVYQVMENLSFTFLTDLEAWHDELGKFLGCFHTLTPSQSFYLNHPAQTIFWSIFPWQTSWDKFQIFRKKHIFIIPLLSSCILTYISPSLTIFSRP